MQGWLSFWVYLRGYLGSVLLKQRLAKISFSFKIIMGILAFLSSSSFSFVIKEAFVLLICGRVGGDDGAGGNTTFASFSPILFYILRKLRKM